MLIKIFNFYKMKLTSFINIHKTIYRMQGTYNYRTIKHTKIKREREFLANAECGFCEQCLNTAVDVLKQPEKYAWINITHACIHLKPFHYTSIQFNIHSQSYSTNKSSFMKEHEIKSSTETAFIIKKKTFH